MSELRKAITQLTARVEMHGVRQEVGLPYREAVNPILDAVIAALPEEETNNEWRSDYPDEDGSAWDNSQGYTEGHNDAVARIKAILEAAKEGK